MELETTTKKVEMNKLSNRHSNDIFSISRLQLCFTRGINSVK